MDGTAGGSDAQARCDLDCPAAPQGIARIEGRLQPTAADDTKNTRFKTRQARDPHGRRKAIKNFAATRSEILRDVTISDHPAHRRQGGAVVIWARLPSQGRLGSTCPSLVMTRTTRIGAERKLIACLVEVCSAP